MGGELQPRLKPDFAASALTGLISTGGQRMVACAKDDTGHHRPFYGPTTAGLEAPTCATRDARAVAAR